MHLKLCINLLLPILRLKHLEVVKWLAFPLELREDASITFQQLIEGMIVLCHDARRQCCLSNLRLHGLGHIEWTDVIWQVANRLIVTASECLLNEVSLFVGVLVEHR